MKVTRKSKPVATEANTSIFLQPEVKQQLKALAADKKTSLSKVIRAAVNEYIAAA